MSQRLGLETEPPAPERLSAAAVNERSRPVVGGWDIDGMQDGESWWSYFAPYTAKLRAPSYFGSRPSPLRSDEREVDMVTRNDMPYAVVITYAPGMHVAYLREEFDEYQADIDDEELLGDRGDALVLDQEDWNELFGQFVFSQRMFQRPVMSFWYPLPAAGENPIESARVLDGLPLCVVEVDGEWGLALTGGGQNMSAQIVEAHVRLGHLPPAQFVQELDVPLGAGQDEALLVEAGLRSLRHAAETANAQLAHFENKIARAKEHRPS
ncbi:MAG: hypothetical protein ABWZ30_00965 [Jiangellaceae bacterium]